MSDDFENHCWADVVPADVLEVYKQYRRRDLMSGHRRLLLPSIFTNWPIKEVPKPPVELQGTLPELAWTIRPCGHRADQRSFAACRAAGLPIFYLTADTRRDSLPGKVAPTKRPRHANRSSVPTLSVRNGSRRPGDVVITKQTGERVLRHAASGAPDAARGANRHHLCGESTSGCVRASAVDAYSNGFHVVLVEECCFDRSLISHKINLFDLHHKYADVMHIDEVLQHLGGLSLKKGGLTWSDARTFSTSRGRIFRCGALSLAC